MPRRDDQLAGEAGSDWGPILAGVVHRCDDAVVQLQPALTVDVPRRTLRIIEGRMQTIRARVIEAEVYLQDRPGERHVDDPVASAVELLELADDDLRTVLALIREASNRP